ncbi:MAG: lysylphosphatidylglycerol synthase domain-containing protein [Candidatus Saccharimonadales bacterium]
MKRTARNLLGLGILILTIVLFVRFFQAHPQYWQQLRHVSPWTVVWVLLLNCMMVALLVAITRISVRLCSRHIGLKENFLLTSYSSIANFFGPLQSGPGVRAVYLKAKHQVRLRDYTLVSLIALGLFAFYSALFLLVGTRPWWQTAGALILVAGASWLVIRLFMKRDKQPRQSQLKLRANLLAGLMILTFLQVVVTVGWYYVELKAVNPHIHLSQAMSYAGAANFSLFVSITPDAIGIREAFLVFSQHIHHVSTANIVSANVIDRGAYVIFLLLLSGFVLSVHASDKLGLKKLLRKDAEVSAR